MYINNAEILYNTKTYLTYQYYYNIGKMNKPILQSILLLITVIILISVIINIHI